MTLSFYLVGRYLVSEEYIIATVRAWIWRRRQYCPSKVLYQHVSFHTIKTHSKSTWIFAARRTCDLTYEM